MKTSMQDISRRVILKSLAGLFGLTISAETLASCGSSSVISSRSANLTPTLPSTGATLVAYLGHSERVNAATWSPDSKLIASASNDKTVQVWNSTNGQLVFTYRGHSTAVEAVSWSPDGTRLVSGDTYSIHVWEAATGKLIYSRHAATVERIMWSPDGIWQRFNQNWAI